MYSTYVCVSAIKSCSVYDGAGRGNAVMSLVINGAAVEADFIRNISVFHFSTFQ